MALPSGTKLGHYEIVAPLGAGGMGEVYRARDNKLDRAVAIKVLTAQVSGDPERLRRFEQEARAASALNHPNIITIYDVGQQDGTSYLAMEFIEGKTLREVMESGPVAQKKALYIASQIAEGLAKAHAAGIVHRDLKPENVMLTTDGLAKILDFGLAKLAGSSQPPEITATVLTPATVPGLVMGTVGYMSPEQARGEPVDFRSDQFSLGTVLYEMLTCKRPFERASSAQTMAAIIEDDPSPVSILNPKAPVTVQWIIERCLAKEPDERYAATRDLARDLQRVRDHLSEAGTGSTLGVTPPPAHHRRWMTAAAASAALLLGFAAGALLFRGQVEEPPVVRNLTFSGSDQGPAISPDGRAAAFTSARDGKVRIWLKQLPAGAEVPITEGPDVEPRFSPDGSMIVFTRQEKSNTFSICRASVVGGEIRRLAEGRSPDWSHDGKKIAFVRGHSIWLMGTDGSNERELLTLEEQNSILRALRWSPDDKQLAAVSVTGGISSENVTFNLVRVDSKKSVSVRPAYPGGDISAVTWVANDQVIYTRSSSVSSVGPLNINASRLIWQEVPSGKSRVLMWVSGGTSALERLGDDRLVLDAMITRENLRQSALNSRDRKPGSDKWLTHGSSIDRQPRWSPDGEWVVFTSNRSGNLDLWEVSTKSGIIRRLTDDPADDWDPGFTPDGKLIWTSHRSGNFEIWMAEADGSSAHQVSHDGLDAENSTATTDGWVIYNSASAQNGLWKVRPDGSEAQRLVAGVENWPEASPTGNYVLATSIGQNRIQPRMQARPEFIGVYQTSNGAEVGRIALKSSLVIATGIGRARWMPDGKSIVFIDSDAGGAIGIYQQEFMPGTDTSDRRSLVVSEPDLIPETFGLSPDGKQFVYAVIDTSSNLLTVEGLRNIGK
jgi:eukaryotic-like serine/threonine-protein kinase